MFACPCVRVCVCVCLCVCVSWSNLLGLTLYVPFFWPVNPSFLFLLLIKIYCGKLRFCVCVFVCLCGLCVCLYVCMSVCVYVVCVCVCMCVYVCVCMCMCVYVLVCVLVSDTLSRFKKYRFLHGFSVLKWVDIAASRCFRFFCLCIHILALILTAKEGRPCG